MQYQVPQFIEIEDKIFGPLTFKQFAYVAGGGAMCFLAYRFFPIYISFFIILPVGGFSLALAFYKVNNRPFIFMVESAAKFFLSKKLYLWQKTKQEATKKIIAPINKDLIPKLSESKLRELTWSLDINDTISKQGIINREPKKEAKEEINSFQGLQDDIKKIKWQ
ncbi:MAG: PrgI family protein [Candidatus Paceibacterota bacterium]